MYIFGSLLGTFPSCSRLKSTRAGEGVKVYWCLTQRMRDRACYVGIVLIVISTISTSLIID